MLVIGVIVFAVLCHGYLPFIDEAIRGPFGPTRISSGHVPVYRAGGRPPIGSART
jgi:hypothetical protein